MAAQEVREFIQERGITEVLHFTTNLGLLGILTTRQLKSRALLETDQYLEFIFTPNAAIRRDKPWSDHVSLSISRANPSFFEISQRWHQLEHIWWCILSFDPEILTHDGGWFVTTNNSWTGAIRGKGLEG